MLLRTNGGGAPLKLPFELRNLLPPDLLPALDEAEIEHPEELRLRIGQKLAVVTATDTVHLNSPKITAQHLDHLLERASGFSAHVSSELLRQGYLHTAAGCRIGFCGTVTGDGTVLRALTSASIRIPRAVPGCAADVAGQLLRDGLENTLLLSPPGCGKTTLLRDLIRSLSACGYRISAADERGELAGQSGRKLGFDLGPNTDVMTGGVKAESAMMLLRAMNPQILAFDEITAAQDLEVIRQAAGCGVTLLATAHAESRALMKCRPLYRELLDSRIFRKAVWIRIEHGRRLYEMERL